MHSRVAAPASTEAHTGGTSTSQPTGPVLVAGGAGFIATHCIAELLRQGFPVRTTARSTSRADAVRESVRAAGADPESVEVVAADLTADAGWAEAMAGCSGVLHVASPVPHSEPKNADDGR